MVVMQYLHGCHAITSSQAAKSEQEPAPKKLNLAHSSAQPLHYNEQVFKKQLAV